ncbi:cob(I)yrinic acid a,c-diamide adenosyltransferase [Longimicrobium terrae]|uniref:Corrinoid adenosyltransferase n=1 Tax=Longimicrobium terrae TaxID=1639882 RepID=A0A841GZ86_9BACT|nr:cob(I)alamin adenosyltransferase [Longimicrobium terrae]MBB6071067.1 cob(I)alamin adenosyltransferase [Longimicrobium terrae]NNC29088.1 cob(I)yrinic acid a,c-diamide adenosyltransferase [Longimicrobium terrae]
MTLKIYTKTGDRGETGLFGGQRVPKDHDRVQAYGDVDELNSLLGVAIVHLEADGQAEIAAGLRAVQSDLFTVGANLATPAVEDGGRESAWIPVLPPGRTAELEAWIDAAEGELEPLKSFVLPGGAAGAAYLHLARTVCRRAERRVVSLSHIAHVGEEWIMYLNRLSDLLFTLARLANRRAAVDNVPWVPNPRGGVQAGS